MPAPSSEYSTDHYLYKYIYTPLSENICFIHPNYISVANMLISTPLVVVSLLNHWSLGAVIAVFLFHTIIDCMDGAVARACDKKSKLGAALDSASDIVFLVAITITIIYLFVQSRGFLSWETISVSTVLIITTLVASIGTDHIHKDDYKSISFIDVVNDNTTVLYVLGGAIAWWLVNRA